jgi:hypothetical protein
VRGNNEGIDREREETETANIQALIGRKTNPASGAINATVSLQWGHIAVL